MEKIKIGDKEYTQEELRKAIDMSSDYTQKTQKLSEEKQMLESEMARVKNLKELDDYLMKHPETAQVVNKTIADDVKKRYGYDFDTQSGQSQPSVARNQQARQRPTSNTNVGYSDYTPTANQNYSDDDLDDEPEYITKKDLEAKLQDVERKVEMKQQQQQITAEINKQGDQLKKMGYVNEEIQKILQTAKQKNMWPLDAAQNLAFNKVVPDRFHQQETSEENKGVKILKGQAGSGFELPDDEKELIQYNNDPSELLKEKYAKNLIKED